MKRTTQLLAISFLVASCASQSTPIQVTPAEPVKASLGASLTAPTPASTPASTPVSTANAPEADLGPRIDCARLPEAPAPSRRWLCELAMSERPSAIADAEGFAIVTEFESPGEEDGVAVDDGHLKRRLCGAEAEAYTARLGREIRYYFSLEEGGDSFVSCDKKSCTLTGMGEYSTNINLTFRSTAKGPALESWSEIEVVLVGEAEVKRREESIDKGLKELAKSTCKP